MRPVLDIQSPTHLRKSALNNIGAKFCKWYFKEMGKELFIRTNAPYFNTKLPFTDWAKHRKLWVVDISSAKDPTLPKEWSRRRPPWVFWTYSGKENNLGPAYGLSSRYAELTRFYADERRFNKMFSVSVTIPTAPPPVAPADGLPFKVISDQLDIQEGPGNYFPRVAGLKKGDTVRVSDLASENDVWVEIGEGKWVPWKLDGKQKLDRE